MEQRKQYVAHVAEDVRAAGIVAGRRGEESANVMAIETALAQGSLDLVSRRDPEKMYHKMTVEELTALGPDFDWAKFFNARGRASDRKAWMFPCRRFCQGVRRRD